MAGLKSLHGGVDLSSEKIAITVTKSELDLLEVLFGLLGARLD